MMRFPLLGELCPWAQFGIWLSLMVDVESLLMRANSGIPIEDNDVLLAKNTSTSCNAGYLVGDCSYVLECMRYKGYPQNICKRSFSIRTCCTKRTTLSALPESNNKGKREDCGILQTFSHLSGKVVGGTVGKYSQFPWTVSLRVVITVSQESYISVHFCGASLINQNWVVTSAHCLYLENAEYMVLRLGEYSENSVNESHHYVERFVASKIIHPEFRRADFYSDIALLKMNAPVSFQPNIQPICLPGNKDLLVGKAGIVSGWGRIKENGITSDIIKMVSLPIISNKECEAMFWKGKLKETIPDVSFCAGYENGTLDACEGDSGGPLQVKGKDGRIFLAGIVSWGYGCAKPFKPGVYTRVSEFVPWIMKIIKESL